MNNKLIISLLIIIISFQIHSLEPEKSLVKITVTSQDVNHSAPWKRLTPEKSVLSGCLIESEFILTHSASMEKAVLIEIVKPGESRRYEADLILYDRQSSLAFLKARDSSFYKEMIPLKLSEVKKPKDEVSFYSWDNGGRFRIYKARYLKTDIEYLNGSGFSLYHQFDQDAQQINEGNPVIYKDRLYGISSYRDTAKKIVYVSALENLHRILKDMKLEGMPLFHISSVYMKGDKNLKKSLGLNQSEEGIYISDITYVSSGYETLQQKDVILEIDGYNIDDQGLIEYPPYGKINYKAVISLLHQVGDTVEMKIFREGAYENIQFELIPYNETKFTIPPRSENAIPDFFLFGGLLFQELSLDYLKTWGKEWEKIGDTRMLFYANNNAVLPDSKIKRYVILNKVFPHEINTGYQSYSQLILSTINDTEITDLKNAWDIIQKSEGYIRFKFIGGTLVVLDKEKAEKVSEELLKGYQIPAPGFFNE